MKKIIFSLALVLATPLSAATQIKVSDIAGFNSAVNALIAAYPPPDLSGLVPKTRNIATSARLAGGGDLTADRTIDLATVGSGGTAGDATHVAVPTVDAYGRVTGLSAVAISFPTTDLSGYVPTSRTVSTSARLTGGGDLTANRTLDLASVGTAGTYGDATNVPVPTIDAYGRVTSVAVTPISFPTVTTISGNAGTATKLATARTIAITGDLAWTSPSFDGSGNVTAASTLATVNSNIGTFGDATDVGTFTVNGKGLITAASSTPITFPSTITGNAGTATALQTARSIGILTGDVTSAGSNFDGSASNTNATTLAASQTGSHTWTSAQTFQGTGSQAIIVDGAAATNRAIRGSTALSARWRVDMPNNAAESGSNAGSDYVITPFSDTGTTLTAAFTITRSTGNATFRGNIVAANFVAGVTTISTDAGATYTLLVSGTQDQQLTAAITANRTVTLPATGALGQMFRFTRAVASTGAFSWNIGSLKALAAGTWCEIVWNGSAWTEASYGSL